MGPFVARAEEGPDARRRVDGPQRARADTTGAAGTVATDSQRGALPAAVDALQPRRDRPRRLDGGAESGDVIDRLAHLDPGGARCAPRAAVATRSAAEPPTPSDSAVPARRTLRDNPTTTTWPIARCRRRLDFGHLLPQRQSAGLIAGAGHRQRRAWGASRLPDRGAGAGCWHCIVDTSATFGCCIAPRASPRAIQSISARSGGPSSADAAGTALLPPSTVTAAPLAMDGDGHLVTLTLSNRHAHTDGDPVVRPYGRSSPGRPLRLTRPS